MSQGAPPFIFPSFIGIAEKLVGTAVLRIYIIYGLISLRVSKPKGP